MEAILYQSREMAVNFDFRKSLWGMKRYDMKILEQAYPLSENESHITYVDKYMDLDANVGFHFEDDSLMEAGYAFREFYPDSDYYLREYERIKSTLTHIHGPPLIQNDICNCSEQDTCCLGTCEDTKADFYLVQWQTCRSIIHLMLVRDEFSTEFGVLHLSRGQDAIPNIYLS